MNWFRFFSIRSKLIGLLLLISSVTISATAYVGYHSGRAAITESILRHLTSVRKLTASETVFYFTTLRAHLQTLSEDLMVREALADFDEAYGQLQADAPAIPEETLEAFYRDRYLPRLAQTLNSDPVTEAYLPRSAADQYLQYRYVLRQRALAAEAAPEAVAAKASADEDRGNDSNEDTTASASATAGASDSALPENSSSGTEGYDSVHQTYHPSLKNIVEEFGYYDLFLIDAAGQIIYSASKEVDFATNLLTGPYSDSGLARAFKAAQRERGSQFVHVEDFSFYRPSYNRPASFIAAPVFSDSQFLGVVAIQLSDKSLREIITQDETWESSGLGETGEVILVGQDRLLRADPRPFIENRDAYLAALKRQNVKSQTLERIENYGSPILLQRAESEAVQKALAGQNGVLIFDNYLNQPSLMAYAPLKVEGLEWGIVTEMSLAEAYEPVYRFQRRVLATAVALSLLVTLLAMFMAYRFTQPILQLMARMGQVGAGNLDTDLRLNTGDEIEELSATLNQIVGDLRQQGEQMQAVKTRNEALLLRFLPDGIVQRLRRSGMEDEQWKVVETAPNVSVILGRISGYEEIMQRLTPEEVIGTLDRIVQGVDAATEQFGVEKVRTFGDSYLAVCGLSTPHLDHARRAVEFAKEMRAIIRRFQLEHGGELQIKCLVASGPASAGIIGRDKLTFDVYGEPVSKVQWLEQQCPPDEVYVSQSVYETLREVYHFEEVAPTSVTLWSNGHRNERGQSGGASQTLTAPDASLWRLSNKPPQGA